LEPKPLPALLFVLLFVLLFALLFVLLHPHQSFPVLVVVLLFAFPFAYVPVLSAPLSLPSSKSNTISSFDDFESAAYRPWHPPTATQTSTPAQARQNSFHTSTN
jgi:hypothetical protein